ncbi:polysaccharide lyase 6 family protein [Candidatus Poribacteria bacterium]
MVQNQVLINLVGILLAFFHFGLSMPVEDHGNIISVSSERELEDAIGNAVPGDVIELADGVYAFSEDLNIKQKKGDEQKPITIRAKNRLKAEITGKCRIRIRDSEYVVLEGLRFTMSADLGGKGGAVNLEGCKHCRITSCHFELDESSASDGNQTWLTVDAEGSGYNRIDHNLFQNKVKEGHYIFVTGDGDYMSQHDLIDHNHFRDRAWGNDENGYETIRGGESKVGNRDGGMFLTVSDNLFERCDGEDEMVSFKCGDCAFLRNTVIDCNGSVVLRTGNRSVVAGNFFLETDEEKPFPDHRCGGVRFYGSDHKIHNNYFENLNGYGMLAPLNIMHGAPAGSGACGGADCLPAIRCEVAHNTWVNCRELRIGYDSDKRPLPPSDCVFANNIVYGSNDKGKLLHLFEVEGIKFSENIIYPTESTRTGIEHENLESNEFRIVDPALNDEYGAKPIPFLTPEDVGPYARDCPENETNR